MLELEPVRLEDQPNVTPDSSATVNSKSDLDNSLIMFQVMVTVCTSTCNSFKTIYFSTMFLNVCFFSQEMLMDLYKWKEKMEQQLMEVSNTVYGMLAMK